MNTEIDPNNNNNPQALPEARVKRSWYPFPILWLVPLGAFVAASWMLYYRYQALGPAITIAFTDANGIKAGETPLRYRGVDVGIVEEISLDENFKHAIVTARLQRSAADIAKESSAFWIVSPELGENAISGLGTVFSGPYISVQPGKGADKKDFSGLSKAPVAAGQGGVHLILNAPHLKNITTNSPVYFRGVKVGSVESVEVNATGASATAKIFILQPYNRLVQSGTKFWNVSGADVKGGLFSGVELQIESLRSLVSGGIAFATPGGGESVSNGAIFSIADEAQDEWLSWSAKIPLPAKEIKAQKSDDDTAGRSVGPMELKQEKK